MYYNKHTIQMQDITNRGNCAGKGVCGNYLYHMLNFKIKNVLKIKVYGKGNFFSQFLERF